MERSKPVPFSRYLVAVETDVHAPLYILHAAQQMDFKYLRKADRNPPEQPEEAVTGMEVAEVAQAVAERRSEPPKPAPLLVDPLDMDRTLTPAILGMDASQFDALRYALSSELTVIQGPPGTAYDC